MLYQSRHHILTSTPWMPEKKKKEVATKDSEISGHNFFKSLGDSNI